MRKIKAIIKAIADVRHLPLIFFTVVAFSAFGVTCAYFFQTAVFINVFETGEYRVELMENFEPTDDWAPGICVPKTVFIVNTGRTDAVVRISYQEGWADHAGNPLKMNGESTLANANSIGESAEETVLKHWSADFNIAWQQIGDYYYYKKVLRPGECVVVLESIELNPLVSCCEHAGVVNYGKASYELDFVKNDIQASSEAVMFYWGSEIANVAIDALSGEVVWTGL